MQPLNKTASLVSLLKFYGLTLGADSPKLIFPVFLLKFQENSKYQREKDRTSSLELTSWKRFCFQDPDAQCHLPFPVISLLHTG